MMSSKRKRQQPSANDPVNPLAILADVSASHDDFLLEKRLVDEATALTFQKTIVKKAGLVLPKWLARVAFFR